MSFGTHFKIIRNATFESCEARLSSFALLVVEFHALQAVTISIPIQNKEMFNNGLVTEMHATVTLGKMSIGVRFALCKVIEIVAVTHSMQASQACRWVG